MKKRYDNIKGIACLCKDDGQIFKVLQNNLGKGNISLTGESFVDIIDKKSRTKAANFLIEVKNNQLALNHTLNIWIEKAIHTLTFLGIRLKEDQVIVVGTENQEDTIKFTHQLQEINNEQANLIRKLMKERISRQNREMQEGDQSYEDLTRLNNELINLQRELSKKNIELERLNETKNRFLGMAAHDLRSPLAIIQGYAAFLKENASGELSEKNKMFLNTIYSTTEFMLNLVEDLLDVSRIESGKLELNKESFNLISFAVNIIEINKPIAQNKGIYIEINCHKEDITIYADRHKIEQVFNNLLNNAIKFSYPGKNIYVDITEEQSKAKVSVEDQGKGISKEDQGKIFQPFEQVSNTGTKGEKGTGLGLIIVKRIVEGHGGKIWVDSEPEKGSTFTFTLPLDYGDKEHG
jgi:signal transduction histidine kinase